MYLRRRVIWEKQTCTSFIIKKKYTMNKGQFVHLMVLFVYILVVMWITDGETLSMSDKAGISFFMCIIQFMIGLFLWIDNDWGKSPLIKKEPSKNNNNELQS